jgi:hypothetical protein
MKKAVVGIVDNVAQAETAVSELQTVTGVGAGDISVLLPDQRASRDFAHEHNTKAPEGAVAGAGAGGLLGGTLGLLAGIGALAIPGVGPFIAAGPLLAALSGAAAGAAVGGISGALIGMGIPEIEAKAYEGKLRGGNVLIAVHTDSTEAQKAVREVLKRNGAHDIDVTTERAVPKDAPRPR